MPGYEAHRLRPSRLTLKILSQLAKESLTPHQLAIRLKVKEMTVARHIWAMQREGIPVQVWRMEGPCYRYVLDRNELWKWLGGEPAALPQRRSNARTDFNTSDTARTLSRNSR